MAYASEGGIGVGEAAPIVPCTAPTSEASATLRRDGATAEQPVGCRRREAMVMEVEDRLMTVKDVARFLDVSPRTAQRMCMTGDIPAARLGLRYYVMRSALIERSGVPLTLRPRLCRPTSAGTSSPVRKPALAAVLARRRGAGARRMWNPTVKGSLRRLHGS